jgi:hypothetical protein
MHYRLTAEATIDAPTDRDALRLMADKLLEIVNDPKRSWPCTGYLGGFGYPMVYNLSVLPDDEE